MNNILIIGGTGNLGSALKYYFENKGYVVYSAKRDPKSHKDILISAFKPLQVPSGVNIDLIINAANKYYPNPGSSEVVEMNDSILGVAQSILLSEFDCPVLYFSSYLQYLPEVFQPWSLYTEFKSRSSEVMYKYNIEKQAKIFEIVLYDNYGGIRKNKFFDQALSAAFNQNPMLATNGESILNLTHISDIVINIEKYVKDNISSCDGDEIYSFSIYSSETFNLRKLVEYIENVAKIKVPIGWGLIPYREKEVFKFYDTRPLLPDFIQHAFLNQYISHSLNLKT